MCVCVRVYVCVCVCVLKKNITGVNQSRLPSRFVVRVLARLQGCLAQKKHFPSLGPPYGPRHRPNVQALLAEKDSQFQKKNTKKWDVDVHYRAYSI